MNNLDLNNLLSVSIITYSRFNHLKRLIESLQKNTLSQYTDVYIGVDFPANDNDIDDNKKVREYLKGNFPQFKSFNVIFHKENIGPSKNSISTREIATKNHKDCIFMEDDLEVAPTFLEFVNTAYEYYKDDPKVVSISGYSFPIDYVVSENATCMRQQLQFRVWGAVNYQTKIEPLRQYINSGGLINDFDEYLKNKNFNKLVDSLQFNYTYEYINHPFSPKNFMSHPTDEALRITIFFKNFYQVIPTKSLVRNHGFDGSGINCPNSINKKSTSRYNYSSQPIDLASLQFKPDSLNEVKKNKKLINKFSDMKMLRIKIIIFIYKLLGRKLFFKLRKKFKKV